MHGLVFFVLFVCPVLSAFYSTKASAVLGQPDFTSGTANNGGLSADSLNIPRGVAYDSQHTLYGIDYGNHRVLKYPVGSGVYGQNGNYNTNGPSAGPNGLRYPSQIAINTLDGALIADGGNHRVLYYPAGTTTASLVFGQANFFATAANRGLGAPTADSLYAPRGLAIDSRTNDFYLADWFNHRVLYFRAQDYLGSGNTTPAFVYGQPDFTSALSGATQDRFYGPNVVTFSVLLNSLIVADTGNHRVLFFTPGNPVAYRVIGQPDYTSNTANNGGRSEWTLNAPYGLAVDSIGGVLVSDAGNHRVTYYLPDRNDALLVFGQPDVFSGTPNNGGRSETSIFQSIGIAIAADIGILSIADMGNNRILQFPIINTVLRNQTVIFPKGGIVAMNSTLEVLGDLRVEGNMKVDGELQVDRTIVNITDALQIDNSTLTVTTDQIGQDTVITVATYSSVQQTFRSVTVVSGREECTNVRPTYGLTALLLTVDCGPNSPTSAASGGSTSSGGGGVSSSVPASSSRGAIIGIVVGCSVLAGVTIAILIGVYFKRTRASRTKLMNDQLKKQELNPTFQHGEKTTGQA